MIVPLLVLYEHRQAGGERTGRTREVVTSGDRPTDEELRPVAATIEDGMVGCGVIVGRLDGRLTTWRTIDDDCVTFGDGSNRARRKRR